MKYLFIAFLFISSISYGQGIEPSSFQPTPYLGGVLRGVTPFVDEFTGQTYYLYVHDSLDASVPYVDTIFMTDFNLYYIKNGDTIYVGSVTDSSFIYNVVSDTFALDMDIDSTNELQELFHQDNILVLTGAGPDSQVDLTPYMDVDSIYMEDYNLWYTKSGESGTPRFVGNVTDSSYILNVVSDSSTVVENDYGTIIVESPANTFGVTVDSSLYMTTYDGTLKENYITPGTTSQYWRGDKTWQTLPSGITSLNGLTGATQTFAISTATSGFTVSSSGTAHTFNLPFEENSTSMRFGLSTLLRTNSVAIGNSAMGSSGISATNNVAIGKDVLRLAGSTGSGGTNNAGIGFQSLYDLTTGINNMAIGTYALANVTSGGDNVGIGNQANLSNTTGSGNIAIGYRSLESATSTENTTIGYFARRAGSGSYNTDIGSLSGESASGSESTMIGYAAGRYNTGSYSLMLGEFSGYNNTRSNSLYIENGTTSSPLIGGQFDNNRVGINTDISSITDALHVTGNIRGTAAYIDATNSSGTSGQVLSSTVTGTDWIDLPAGDITAVTVSAPVTGSSLSGPIPNIGVDTTATTGSALATQFDISTKVSGSGTDNYIPRFNGTTAIENSIMYDDGTMIGIGNTSPSRTLHVTGEARITDLTTDITPTVIIGADVNGVLESLSLSNLSISGGTTLKGTGFRVNGTGSFNSGDLNLAYATGANPTTYPTWTYSAGDFTFRLPYATSGQVLKFDGTGWAAGTDTGGTYAYWRLSANDGTPYAVTDDALIDFENSTGITWTRSGGEMTATLADNSATNEIQSLSYNTGTRALGITSGSGVTLPLVTSIIPGLVSAYPNNTTSFLRGDGTWATPPTPSVTGSAPIVVTSGNISLNFGNGLALSGSQLQTTPVIMAFLNHSSGGYTTNFTAGETKKVDFTTALSNSSITTDVSTNDNITINSAGTYEINYNVCINAPTNFDEPTVSIYVNGSQQGTTVKSVWLTVAGQKQCISGTHVMALSSSNTVDMRVQHPQAQTGANIIAPQLKVQKLF